jgi:hypothetical protein
MLRALALAAVVALAVAPSVLADVFGAAQVRTPDGALLARASGGSFSYPADGSIVSVGSIATSSRGVVLRDVSLLGGRAHADRVVLRQGRGSRIDNLVVDGLVQEARQNGLYPLDSDSYLVVLQKAVIGDKSGFVGLRLTLAPGYPGLPSGAQVLIGLRQRGPTARLAARAVETAAGPWATLGFGGVPSISGVPIVSSEPLATDLALPTNGLGGRAVQIALQYLGTPYVWGGADPQTGFDCSGLTMYVYGQLGISLTHYTGAQIHEGTPVPEQLLQPGDLVFFDPGPFGVPGHEGMYIGGGLFVQAPHTGDVVKISPLASYQNRYVGAVRPHAA